MNDLFIKNLAIMTPEEAEILKEKKILVAGCGGLGSSVIELLARTGIGHLILTDRDVFEPTNMNRQILCTLETLGKSKAETALRRVLQIDPDIDASAVCENITKDNARDLIRGCDLVIDALDSVSSRLLLEDACADEGIVLIHGAVNGWSLQTGVCPPGAGMLHTLFGGKDAAEHAGGGIAMTVFTCAAFEVSEAVKLLLNRSDSLLGKILLFDLISKESDIIDLL